MFAVKRCEWYTLCLRVDKHLQPNNAPDWLPQTVHIDRHVSTVRAAYTRVYIVIGQ